MIRVNRQSYLSNFWKNFISFSKIFRNEIQRYIMEPRSLVLIGIFLVWNLFNISLLMFAKEGLFDYVVDVSEFFIPPDGHEAEWAIRNSMSIYFSFLTLIVACYFGALFARDIQHGTLRLFCVTPIPRSVHLLSRTTTAIIATYLYFFIGHIILSVGIIILYSKDLFNLSILIKFILLFLKLQIIQLISIFFGACFGTCFGMFTKRTGTATILFFMLFTMLNFLSTVSIFLPTDFQDLMLNFSFNFHYNAIIWSVSSILKPGMSFLENQWIVSLAVLLGIPTILLGLIIHYFCNMDLD